MFFGGGDMTLYGYSSRLGAFMARFDAFMTRLARLWRVYGAFMARLARL
jgi:hypothetical protein